MNKLSIICATILLPCIASADFEKISDCHELAGDEMRLICYDKVSGYSENTKPSEADELSGAEQQGEQ